MPPIERPSAEPKIYPGGMLDPGNLDLEQIATALGDQANYEYQWLINPETGEVAFWTADTGIDGHTGRP